MTTADSVDWPTVLANRLATTHLDVLRELLSWFIHTLMGAEADALCGDRILRAQHGARQLTQRLPASPIRHLHRHIGLGKSPRCDSDPTSRTGCWNAANAPSGL